MNDVISFWKIQKPKKVGEVKCECRHCEPIPCNSQGQFSRIWLNDENTIFWFVKTLILKIVSATQYNAPIEMGTSTNETAVHHSSLRYANCMTNLIDSLLRTLLRNLWFLSYWEYESIQQRCIRLQEKNDELREELEKEVKLKLGFQIAVELLIG